MSASHETRRWKRGLAGAGFLLAGLGLLLRGIRGLDGFPDGGNDAAPPFFTAAAGAVLLLAGLIAVATAAGRRGDSASLLRLDHFLPFLRKKRRPSWEPAWITRAARRVLPPACFFDPETGQQGLVRRFLQSAGRSVVSSPGRRLVQGVCFVLFLVLFFYVCWPYTAVPEAPGTISSGWRLASIDQEELRVVLAGNSAGAAEVSPGRERYLVAEDAAAGPEAAHLGLYRILSRDREKVVLVAADESAKTRFTALLIFAGPWTLHESEPGKWPSHYADDLAAKEKVPADLFLVIDPLVSISTALAARSWVWSLIWAGVILLVCVLIPRGFCGYLCPLGTLIDLFDWALGRRVKRFRVRGEGWWVHIKYYLLAGVLIAALGGVLLSGFVAAIPVLTRGLLFLGEPLQSGLLRGWHLVVPLNAGHFLSLALFCCVLGLGLLRPRFWCKYVCPSGAVFSLGNLFRVTERKVESSCINCNQCVEVCPFDAIKPDFTTRVTDCTLCQTCGGVCPTHSIKFVERWNVFNLKTQNEPETGETPLGRRGFISLLGGASAAVAGGLGWGAVTKLWGARLDDPSALRPVRPPGSVPEPDFLQMCIRCGECFKACPNNVLQPMGFEQGLEGLWTPFVNADWAGCESSCNACGQVCPTGAIRPLPLAEKKVARMGLAIVDEETCLPFAGREACQLCVDECVAAGYDAIEFTRVHTETDAEGIPVEGSGFVAPVVLSERCVGCGLCQMRCYGINVAEKHLLAKSAIIVKAGEEKEDRMLEGSYLEKRAEEARRREAVAPKSPLHGAGRSPVRSSRGSAAEADPFGLAE